MKLKSFKTEKMENEGSISIYLLIILVVILSFISTMIEGARLKATKAEVSAAAHIASENMAASYCLELFEDYGIFYYHGTKEEAQAFLTDSMEKNLLQTGMFGVTTQGLEIQEINSALEENGEDFRKQAVTYMKESLPKEWIREIRENKKEMKEKKTEGFEKKVEKAEKEDNYVSQKELKNIWKSIKKVMRKNKKKSLKKSPARFKAVMEKTIKEALVAIEEYEKKIEGGIQGESYLRRDKKILEDALDFCGQIKEEQKKLQIDKEKYRIEQLELPKKENSTWLEDMKRLIQNGKLSLVLPKGVVVSEKKRKDHLPSRAYQKRKKKVPLEETLYFTEFCKRNFGNYTEQTDSYLKYELEYLIAGKMTDKENLTKVVDQLILIREGWNLVEIIKDKKKSMECEEMAVMIAGWTGVPAIVTLTKGLVMAAWALGESIVDVKNLLKGGQVPLKKGKEDWQTELGSLTKLKETKETKKKKGLKYKDYLQMLIWKENTEVVTMRSMDLIQMDLEERYQSKFRFEQCVKKGRFIYQFQCKTLFPQVFFSYQFEKQYTF